MSNQNTCVREPRNHTIFIPKVALSDVEVLFILFTRFPYASALALTVRLFGNDPEEAPEVFCCVCFGPRPAAWGVGGGDGSLPAYRVDADGDSWR